MPFSAHDRECFVWGDRSGTGHGLNPSLAAWVGEALEHARVEEA
jgi:hypothetical protein